MSVEYRVTDVPENIHDESPDQPTLTSGESATIVLTGDQTEGTFALIDAVHDSSGIRKHHPGLACGLFDFCETGAL